MSHETNKKPKAENGESLLDWDSLQATAKSQFKNLSDKAVPFVKERPLVALGVVALAGFLVGALLSRDRD